MNRLRILLRYIRYYRSASTKHDLHSPFVFRLMTEVIEKDHKEISFQPIEQLRNELLHCNDIIEVNDLGAGSTATDKKQRSIRDIAKTASKQARYARLLYRLSKHFKPTEILELGTSFGISTLYLHAAQPEAHITTIEGCAAVAAKAQQHFKKLGASSISLVQAGFDQTLPEVLRNISKADLVFFDGNHRLAPTLGYFRQCLEKAHEGSIFIFDDIHWSDEMETAWKEIQQHPSVTVTADLFFMGLVFFRKGQEKQHFILRY